MCPGLLAEISSQSDVSGLLPCTTVHPNSRREVQFTVIMFMVNCSLFSIRNEIPFRIIHSVWPNKCTGKQRRACEVIKSLKLLPNPGARFNLFCLITVEILFDISIRRLNPGKRLHPSCVWGHSIFDFRLLLKGSYSYVSERYYLI